MIAYLAGLLTLPAIVAVSFVRLHIAAEGRPGAAWRMIAHRPTLPAWQWYARRAGRHLAWEHYALFQHEVDVWAEQDRQRARQALVAPWCPAIFWPPHLLRVAGLVVGVR